MLEIEFWNILNDELIATYANVPSKPCMLDYTVRLILQFTALHTCSYGTEPFQGFTMLFTLLHQICIYHLTHFAMLSLSLAFRATCMKTCYNHANQAKPSPSTSLPSKPSRHAKQQMAEPIKSSVMWLISIVTAFVGFSPHNH